MSLTSFGIISMISLFVLITPILGHRLITGDVQNAYDSVIVTSDPIKITNSKYDKNNETAAKKPDYAIRFNRNTLTGDKNSEVINSQERSFKDCKHNDIKCLYGNRNDVEDRIETTSNKNQDIINKFLEQYSAITNVKFNYDDYGNSTNVTNTTDGNTTTTTEKNSNSEKKSYWSLVNSEKHNHPYDDKKGWVTLEPVPWSTSKVSKWQPHHPPNPPMHHYPSHQDKPWNYDQVQRPTAQVWVSNRPEQETYYRPSNLYPSYRPTSQWGIGSNDIITDNRPSNFPDGNGAYTPYQKPDYHAENNYHHQSSSGYNDYQYLNHGYPNSRPSRYPSYPSSNIHPSTYPDRGNGEWILLSTTKGYSLPQRYRDTPKILLTDTKSQSLNDLSADPFITSRNMKFPDISRYHEENIDDKYVLVSKNNDVNRKSGEQVEEIKLPENVESFKLTENEDDKKNASLNMEGLRVLHSENGGSILAAAKGTGRNGKDDWKMDETPLQILETNSKKLDASPTMTYKRTVRLTVLPPIHNTSTTSHGGLLEVDSNFQSVDEAAAHQLEQEKIHKLSEIAHIKNANLGQQRQLSKLQVVPVPIRRKAMDQSSAAVLAAIGAGMIPATMAVLVPMALGRKRRSVDSNIQIHPPFYRNEGNGRW